MADLTGFDARKVEPNSFEALPAGDYPVVIVASEMKDTKDKQGKFLELKLQVLSGQFQNRTLYDRLNLVNKNDQAVQIAKGTLSAICRAVNVLTPKDSAELHSKPMVAAVKAKKADDGNIRNEVAGYKPRGTTAAKPAEKNMIEEAFEAVEEEVSTSPF